MHWLFFSLLPFIFNRTPVSSKKEEKKSSEKDCKDVKKQDSKTNKSDVPSSSSGADAAKKDDKKHGRMLRFDCIHQMRRFKICSTL